MSLFILNVALALGWAALAGSIELHSLLTGFAIGYAALWLTQPLFGETAYFVRVRHVIRLIAYFFYELVASSLRVVWDVFTRDHLSRPGIVAVPLDANRDGEILLVASLISLTPGSLSLDVSADRKTLYVHAMFVEDPAEQRRSMKEGFERMVIEALR